MEPGERLWDVGYSRAPTAPLDDVDGSESHASRASRHDKLAVVRHQKPHMQLFVLGYGETKDVDGEPPETRSIPARVRGKTPAAPRPVWGTLGPGRPDVDPDSDDGDSDDDFDDDLRDKLSVVDAEHPDAFANAMQLPMRVGQFFSVMPANAMTGEWRPRRAAYAFVVSGGLSLLAALCAVKQFSKKPTLVELMVVMFYSMSAVTSWLFVRLARYWGGLLRAFRGQERCHGTCVGLRHKLNAIVVSLLVVAFVEHSLSEFHIVKSLREFHPNASTFSEYLKIYYTDNYSMVELVIGYWPLLTPFCFFLNFVATFLWNFNDLFIMLVGVALASRFRTLQESVSKSVGDTVEIRAAGMQQPVLGSAYWRSTRNTYNSLTKLVRKVDKTLSVHILVSFVNNLYFVCMQLLRGFDASISSWHNSVYIIFSFSFLVLRTSAVSLLAASVRDHSRSIRDTLYCVSSDDYDQEVYRFLVQVTSEEVALTGCNMFKITRGLLLTVAGTILTYEVVLVQLPD